MLGADRVDPDLALRTASASAVPPAGRGEPSSLVDSYPATCSSLLTAPVARQPSPRSAIASPACLPARSAPLPTGPSSAPTAPRRRRRSALQPLGVALASALVGYAAGRDPRAAHLAVVILAGVSLSCWARLAWRAKPPPGPFGLAVTRTVDRAVTAVGTFFAVALWARYAPDASASFSRTLVLALCGLGLIGGSLATVRNLFAGPVRGLRWRGREKTAQRLPPRSGSDDPRASSSAAHPRLPT